MRAMTLAFNPKFTPKLTPKFTAAPTAERIQTALSLIRAGVTPHRVFQLLVGCLLGIAMMSCGRSPQSMPPRTLEIQQQWQLQPGSQVAGLTISGGLGDISVELQGAPVYAPFDGDVQPLASDCLIYSSPDVPAYVFRLCGLGQIQWGGISQGDRIGRGQRLQFAALRKQPEGQWAIVEPSRTMLEQMLTPP